MNLLITLLACSVSDFGFHGIPGELDSNTDDPMVYGSAAQDLSVIGGSTADLGDADPELPVSEGADVVLSWSGGSPGADRSSAVVAQPDGSVVIASLMGQGAESDLGAGPSIMRVEPDGSQGWVSMLAPPTETFVVDSLLPAPDGGVWACMMVPGGAVLHPDIAALPADWGNSLLMIHVDASGQVVGTQALGSSSGGTLDAGCGTDEQGELVIDGTIAGGPAELQLAHGRMLMPTVVDRGFVITTDSAGALQQVSTWDALGLHRQASAVLPDGSVAQVFRYAGVPQLELAGQSVAPCPTGKTCMGLLRTDRSGAPIWQGDLGADPGPTVFLSAMPNGELLLGAQISADTVLPRADGDSLFVASSGTAVARYASDMSLDWVSLMPEGLFLQGMSGDLYGETFLSIWTGAAAQAQVGTGLLELEDRDGTTVLAALSDEGPTSWLWQAQGSGVAWPTGLVAVNGQPIVTLTFQGDVTLDADGPTETQLSSRADDAGEPSTDVAVLRLVPRR